MVRDVGAGIWITIEDGRQGVLQDLDNQLLCLQGEMGVMRSFSFSFSCEENALRAISSRQAKKRLPLESAEL
ncbi:hypothetical protein [Streptomyces sp. NPDC055109]